MRVSINFLRSVLLPLAGAAGQSLCSYVGIRNWQPLGSESRASRLLNPVGQTDIAAGNFDATLRDYARLGWLTANDGRRDSLTVKVAWRSQS